MERPLEAAQWVPTYLPGAFHRLPFLLTATRAAMNYMRTAILLAALTLGFPIGRLLVKAKPYFRQDPAHI